MNRREFCRHLAALGGAALLSSCRVRPNEEVVRTPTRVIRRATSPNATALPTATGTVTSVPLAEPTLAPAPSPTPVPTGTAVPALDPTHAQIAVVRTTDRAQGVRQAIELLGLNPVRGNHVLFKPNLNSADPAPGSTHPDVMRAMLVALEDMGARSITLGERSGMGNTRQVMEQTGVFALEEEFGFATVAFDELEEQDWIVHRSADHHWADGFAVPSVLLDTESIVQVCNLKTHRYGGHFTLALKNSVGFAAKWVRNGGYNYMTELHNSPYQRHMIAEINAVYRPALIVMDGVEAFLTGGPSSGSKAQTGVILAGTDPVAMDAVGVAILRLFGTTSEVSQGRIFEQEQLRRAVELELGVDNPGKIDLLTNDVSSEAFALQVLDMLRAA